MKSKFLGLLAVGLLAGPMTANAELIVFDDYTNLGIGTGTNQTLTNLGSSQAYSMAVLSGKFEITSADELNLKDFTGSDPARTVKFSRSDSGLFNFLGFDGQDFFGTVALASDKGGAYSCTSGACVGSKAVSGSAWEGISWFTVSTSQTFGEAKFNSFSVESTAPVPLPAAAWLLLSGIAGLGVLGRRRNAH